jgi:hypothetical protein
MGGREMCVPLHHRERPPAAEFLHARQVDNASSFLMRLPLTNSVRGEATKSTPDSVTRHGGRDDSTSGRGGGWTAVSAGSAAAHDERRGVAVQALRHLGLGAPRDK